MTDGMQGRGWGKALVDTVGGWFGTVRGIVATRYMPQEEIAVTVLALLAEKGRTSTLGIYEVFADGNLPYLTGKAIPEDGPGYVALFSLFSVLEALEDDGRVYCQKEDFEGRLQCFWSLNTWGGTRRRAKAEAGVRTSDSGLVPAPSRRDALH